MSTTANMGMVLPVPGTTGALGTVASGTSWLELLNSALAIIDQHTHAPGSGAAVTSSGISINGDLPFNSHNATGMRTTRFTPIALGALGTSDVGAIFVSGSDLYYVDTAGSVVRLTASGAVAGTPGSITSLASPAAVTYSAGSKQFDFTSQSGVRAALLAGPLSIYDPVAAGNSARIKVPSGLASSYALTLLSALPAGQSFVTIDASGAVATPIAYSGGITSTNIAPNGVARSNLPLVGQQLSASSGLFGTTSTTAVDVTGVSVSITTTGRPVVIMLVPDGSLALACIGPQSRGATGIFGTYAILRGSTLVGQCVVGTVSGDGNSISAPPGSVAMIDAPVAGTYTYKLQTWSNDTSGGSYVQYVKLLAFEL